MSDMAADFVAMRAELAELEKLCARRARAEEKKLIWRGLPFFNARYFLRCEVFRSAAYLIGAGCINGAR